MTLMIGFPMSGIILGIISIAITVGVLLLIGAIIVWFASWIGFAVPEQVQRIFLIVVALIALYMLAALLFGLPVPSLTGLHGMKGLAYAIA
jgi:hypothetical protein